MNKFSYVIKMIIIGLISIFFMENDFFKGSKKISDILLEAKYVFKSDDVLVDMIPVVLSNDSSKENEDSVSNVGEISLEDVVLERQVGKLSGYGPDCLGCSGYLANSMYVGDGTIYYEDRSYGKVRIVAGDNKYPFGSIVRVKNSKLGDFLAIVLDRGGVIGIGKKCLFDLLYPSEVLADADGISYDVVFEVLRYGY